MTQRPSQSSLAALLGNLGWPVLIGGAMCSIFLAGLYGGPLNTPLMMRYFAGHPINLMTTCLFFVGMAALMLKGIEILRQNSALSLVELPPAPPEGQRVEDVGSLLDSLSALSDGLRNSYLGRRFNDLLESVERKGTAVGLDDEIKYLADLDVARQQDSYALVRIVIWAAPMLGFLGTVVGITDALGDLGSQFANNKEAANDISQAMNGLLAGLYVAFDTTAQALLLSMVLMFVQFACDRAETQVLSSVDAIAAEEMTGRFQELGGASDPHLASIQRMLETVVRATETLVDRQAVLWRSSLEISEKQWQRTLKESGTELRTALSGALEETLAAHTEALKNNDLTAEREVDTRFAEWRSALGEHQTALRAVQNETAKQTEILAAAVKAAGEVTSLETALNANLAALAGAKHFEETALSMAAAVNLLSARLGKTESPRIDLHEGKPKGRAA